MAWAPSKWHDEVRQRLDILLALDEVPARLVHGDLLRAATDEQTYRRARAWDGAVGVEHLHAVFADRPPASPDGFVSAVVAWLERR